MLSYRARGPIIWELKHSNSVNIPYISKFLLLLEVCQKNYPLTHLFFPIAPNKNEQSHPTDIDETQKKLSWKLRLLVLILSVVAALIAGSYIISKQFLE